MGVNFAPPIHVAIIMDGNGRWASLRGRPRSEGHRAGSENVRRIVRAAADLGVGTLTLYAFSADNWQRPSIEVSLLMRLLHNYLANEAQACVENGVRISVIGRRDRLSRELRTAIEAAEIITANEEKFHLRLAVDYSAREAIYRAACRFYKSTQLSREAFEGVMGEVMHDDAHEVDLLIRTGGEQRLSDFLLWESAYAELYFTEKMWPDFGTDDLSDAIAEFRARDRRFGRVTDAVAS
ncbi:MAG TPA: di-trans,poly-cis-decaprenylcistransferase [Candidatus Acidoferrales bacterium]|nr:di-trans,poly-cis-decaprenylcistransferase [Candidatus Acidoferrales bacterium]